MSKPRLRPWVSCLAFFTAVAASVPLGLVPPVLFGFLLGYYLILGRLPKRIESAGEPVRRLAEDAFLLYYNPK